MESKIVLEGQKVLVVKISREMEDGLLAMSEDMKVSQEILVRAALAKLLR